MKQMVNIGLACAIGLLTVDCTSGTPSAPLNQLPTPDSLAIDVLVSSPVFSADTVPVRLDVINTTDRSLRLTVGHEPWTYDLRVLDPEGSEVWRKLPRIIPLVATILKIEPGDTVSFQDEWPQTDHEGNPVSPGSYQVQGILMTDQGELPGDMEELIIKSESS